MNEFTPGELYELPPALVLITEDPAKFKELEIEEQLDVIAELVLFYADKVYGTLAQYGKKRVDQCPEALYWKNRQEFWENKMMNLKKVAELENTKARRGI